MSRRKSLISAPWRAILWLPKGLLAALALALLVLNTATILTPAAFGPVSQLVEGVVGQRTVRAEHAAQIEALRAENAGLGERLSELESEVAAAAEARSAIAEASFRLAARIEAGAARDLAALPGEALPFLGLAVATAAAAQSLSDACASMDDLAAVAAAAGTGTAPDPAAVCALSVPQAADTWAAIADAPEATWEALTEAYPELPEPGVWNVYALTLRRGAERHMGWLAPEEPK